ncbi:MAG: TIGR02117 family protein [Sphingomonas sp.]
MTAWNWRRMGRVALRTAGGILAIPLLYVLAALVLGLVPANSAWRQADSGIAIFVRTNGVHTWILMPKTNAHMDWRPMVPGRDVRDPRWDAADYVAFGYGEREVYLNTPTWADLSVPTAVRAAIGGGEPLMHVEHVHDPRPDEYTRRLVLRSAEYRRLVGFVRARFRLDSGGRTVPVPGRGYRDNDIFYLANGGYSAILTCNEWTGRALRAAGVRTGLWTPLEQSIMWRLD